MVLYLSGQGAKPYSLEVLSLTPNRLLFMLDSFLKAAIITLLWHSFSVSANSDLSLQFNLFNEYICHSSALLRMTAYLIETLLRRF